MDARSLECRRGTRLANHQVGKIIVGMFKKNKGGYVKPSHSNSTIFFTRLRKAGAPGLTEKLRGAIGMSVGCSDN